MIFSAADKPVRRAEERCCRARMMRVRGLILPHSSVCTTAATARGDKRLPSGQNQAILPSSDRPFGECRLNAIFRVCFRHEPRRFGHLQQRFFAVDRASRELCSGPCTRSLRAFGAFCQSPLPLLSGRDFCGRKILAHLWACLDCRRYAKRSIPQGPLELA